MGHVHTTSCTHMYTPSCMPAQNLVYIFMFVDIFCYILWRKSLFASKSLRIHFGKQSESEDLVWLAIRLTCFPLAFLSLALVLWTSCWNKVLHESRGGVGHSYTSFKDTGDKALRTSSHQHTALVDGVTLTLSEMNWTLCHLHTPGGAVGGRSSGLLSFHDLHCWGNTVAWFCCLSFGWSSAEGEGITSTSVSDFISVDHFLTSCPKSRTSFISVP